MTLIINICLADNDFVKHQASIYAKQSEFKNATNIHGFRLTGKFGDRYKYPCIASSHTIEQFN